MNRILSLVLWAFLFAGTVWTSLVWTSSVWAASDKPNIILIMADDVGIEAFGCYGGVSYKTPHLDALARDGVRFTHAFSQPLCTPTRVQLMTGKYNHRNWRSFGILDPTEKTFGHSLRDAGYATAIFGKWQLFSYDPPDFPGAAQRRSTGMHPKDAGFAEYALFHALQTEDKGSRYANPTMLEGTAGSEGTLKTYSGLYGEDVWVDKTVDFLDRHRDQPAFVYYPMALPHWPFVPTPTDKEWNPAEPPTESMRFAASMIEYVDTAVGRLLEQLRAKQLRDNTIVLFYSDNGTHLQVRSKLADGRTIQGGKATPLQTGIHVPLIVSWPGQIAPGVSDALVDASDFLPTFIEWAGAKLPAERVCDGISFAGQLDGRDETQRKAVFVWYDPRPGWDKDRFERHVFALDKHHKCFRDGRLFRLTDRPLEEIEISADTMTDEDRRARKRLQAYIEDRMQGVIEPPLLDAYGNALKH